MKTNIVKYFLELLEGIPAKGIPLVIELEREMLMDDSLHERIADGEVASIFIFCEFVKAVSDKDMITPVALPKSHVAGYKTIVMRLIEAGELPATALEQFYLTFRAS
jgi:hypothetical protein